MIYNFKEYKLFESPDTLYFEKENIELEWSDPDAIAFLYIKPEFYYIYDEYIHNKILISAPGVNHPDMLRDKYKQTYPSIHQMKEMQYIGRLWYESKVISFWDYPETKEKLYSIINDINNSYDSFKIDDSWYIEVIVEKNDKKEYAWKNHLNKTKFIHINEFKGSKDFSEEERKIHLLKAAEKRKVLRKLGYKPKHKSKNMIDAKYNHITTKNKFTESNEYRDYSNIILLENDLNLVLLDIKTDIVVGVINLYPVEPQENFDYGQVGSVGSERGYGLNLYKFGLYKFWLKHKKPIMPSRDGDVSGEAMNVWTKLYNDKNIKTNTLEWEDDEFTLSILFGEQDYYTIDEKEEIYQNFLENGEDLKQDKEIKIFNTEFILDTEPDMYSELKEKGEKYKKENKNWKEYLDVDYSIFFKIK